MLTFLLAACSADPILPSDPPDSAPVGDSGASVPEPEAPPCLDDPGCLSYQEAPVTWELDLPPTFREYRDGAFWFTSRAETDYTGDGIPDVVAWWPHDYYDGGSMIIPGPLNRGIRLPGGASTRFFHGELTPAGDGDGDGIGDLLYSTKYEEESGLVPGPFAGPFDPEAIDPAGAVPVAPRLAVEDPAGGNLYVSYPTDHDILLYRGPFGAAPEPFLELVTWPADEPNFFYPYQVGTLPGAAGPALIVTYGDWQNNGLCYGIAPDATGVLDASTDPRATLVDLRLCRALPAPDQDGDGIGEIWVDGAVYPGPAGADTFAAAPLAEGALAPKLIVPDVNGDGVEDVIACDDDGNCGLQASGGGWLVNESLVRYELGGASHAMVSVPSERVFLAYLQYHVYVMPLEP